MNMAELCPRVHPLKSWMLAEEPFYLPVGSEVKAFEAAWRRRLPVLLKGPTGCGKTRFVEYMAWKLGKPLVTVSCHEDLTANDLVGRWLLDAQGTQWQDGPLTLAARHGAICYLDEIIEARADTTVVTHPLCDSRRVLPLEKRNELLYAHGDFHLVASYNPSHGGYGKTMKASTRQRFTALNFDYPAAELEAKVLVGETGIDATVATRLVSLGAKTRQLQDHGLEEGASTRMLVRAASLVQSGLSVREACQQAIAAPLSDDPDLSTALKDAIELSFAC